MLRRDLLASLSVPLLARAHQYVEGKGDVPFVPTPDKAITQMLKLAHVKPGDIVYDLGCGDGRIPVAAALQYGARAVGIDIDPDRIKEAREHARQSKVEDKVEFREQDMFQADISDATVVALYLLPRINLKLRPKLLAELKPGTRIVSHTFDMGDWKPKRKVHSNQRPIYLWVIPPK